MVNLKKYNFFGVKCEKSYHIDFFICYGYKRFICLQRNCGGGVSHNILLSSSGSLAAQGVAVSVQGSNVFDKNNIFGLEYTFGYPVMFGRLGNDNIFMLSLKAIADLKPTSGFGIIIKLGPGFSAAKSSIKDYNTFDVMAGVEFYYKLKDDVSLGFDIEYKTPILIFYDKTASEIAFTQHFLRYGLFAKYIY